MSSKAARRRAEYNKRQEKRKKENDRRKAINEATDLESLAKVMGVRLK